MYILQVAEENHRALSTDTVEGKFRRLDSLVNTKINTGFKFISTGSFSFALYADYACTLLPNEQFYKLLFAWGPKRKDDYLLRSLSRETS